VRVIARRVTDGPQQLAGDRAHQLDRRPVVVVLPQRFARDILQLLSVDVFRQTDGVHPDARLASRLSLVGSRLRRQTLIGTVIISILQVITYCVNFVKVFVA